MESKFPHEKILVFGGFKPWSEVMKILQSLCSPSVLAFPGRMIDRSRLFLSSQLTKADRESNLQTTKITKISARKMAALPCLSIRESN